MEFIVNITSKVANESLTTAHNQTYVLPVGAFLKVNDGKIS